MDPSIGTPSPDRSLPARRIDCTLHHALGVDPAKDQSPEDIRYEGVYRLSLLLPPAAGARPADYRLTRDDQALFGPARAPFTRVADQWPKTVQLARATPGGVVFFILSGIDPAARAAHGYVSRGTDGANIDTSWIFQGDCTIATGPSARTGAR